MGGILMEDILKQIRQYASEVSQKYQQQGLRPLYLHIYKNTNGKFIYAKPRLKNLETGEKRVFPISLDAHDHWQMKEPDFIVIYPEGNGLKPLYLLPELTASKEVVYIVEGEQKADILNSLGFTATTTGGSNTVNSHYWQPLSGRKCILWRDNDEAGVKWLDYLIKKLASIPSGDIDVIDISQLDLPVKGDVVDYVVKLRDQNPQITDEEIAQRIKNLPIMSDEQVYELLPELAPSSIAESDDIDEKSLPSIEEAQSVINNLATISKLEYALQRTSKASSLGMSVTLLDNLVKDARQQQVSDDKSKLVFDVEPCDYTIDGNKLANKILELVNQYIVCEIAVAIAVTLWIFFTWVVDISHIAPIAWVNAPEKRCGKTQLAIFISKLCCRPLLASNISPSAMFRSIEKYQPTLIIDEADTFIKDNPELKGIFNAGFSRDNPYIIRSVGDDHEPTPFLVFCPKVISGIGDIPETIRDRSISLELRRKMPNEVKKKLRDLNRSETEKLRSELARWSADNIDKVKAFKVDLPSQINDRAQDCWEILFKVAGVLGDGWNTKVREACLSIANMENEEPSLNEQLLLDIQETFEQKRQTKIFTEDLMLALCSDPEKNWQSYNRGKPITPKQLATRLKGYGIAPKKVRIGGTVKSGYDKSDFIDAFNRYLPKSNVTPLQPSDSNGLSQKTDVTSSPTVTDEKMLETSNIKDCNAVTDKIIRGSV